ncbi:YdhK family protein [Paenibacillus pseudetheri]|uniref:DUF1541 domain-containing protein n=1 Tax=Paenibacillus pseudetheri TaxID=2897682 RepID=A0ABM9BIR7_9BACL|nr:YdhK family protein [Paenibacillus pseudetheri]CAH1058911.1 putative protein YdhK [Paenibacillus pseudetheri]
MKKQLYLFIIAAALTLSACGNDNSYGNKIMEDTSHSSSSDVPENLKVAEDPTFKIGSKAIIQADHMEGMRGAIATIVGAFDTTAYNVSYRPATGGFPVTNHKWIIHEEIKKAADKPYESGSEVIMEADHMKGMKGATAQINAAEQTAVYMIDYMPTTGEDKVKNHKWVTEDELSAIK